MRGSSTSSGGASPVSNVPAEVVARIESASSLLVVTHARPDGDGLGSMAALACCAKAAGRAVTALVPDRVPQRYEALFAEAPATGPERFAALAADVDAIVILDTCAFAQLDGLVDTLREVREKVVVIDHHATADDVGASQWVDRSAAAAGVMVGELLEALGWDVPAAAAEAMMTAVTTDTGWLRFANTDGRCLRAVAAWIDAGVRPDVLYKRIYQSDRPERLRLMARVIDGLELHCGGALAVMTIRKADFEQTGAREDETENLVNEALRIGSVETAVILVENSDCVRASLRSRDAIDVAAIAKEFGGGGHQRAAGLRRDEDLDALKQRLVERCCEALLLAQQNAECRKPNVE